MQLCSNVKFCLQEQSRGKRPQSPVGTGNTRSEREQLLEKRMDVCRIALIVVALSNGPVLSTGNSVATLPAAWTVINPSQHQTAAIGFSSFCCSRHYESPGNLTDCIGWWAAFGVANFDVENHDIQGGRLIVGFQIPYASKPICSVQYTYGTKYAYLLKPAASPSQLEISVYNLTGEAVNWQSAVEIRTICGNCFGPVYPE